MIFLQKDTPFIWDDIVQCSFDALKHALNNTPLFHPLDYAKEYILYLVSSTSTIAMVLVQEYNHEDNHLIYYLSKSLCGPEL
jgi:hypothetical protein